MNLSTYLTPWTIGGAVAGLVLSVGAIIALVINRRHVGVALKRLASSLFSQIGFFSVVIIVFMVISVLESGAFFDANITHHAIFGLLGYALALGFDLVSIVCMLARLNAQRMRDEHGSRLNLIGVILCATVSAFANAAGSLQGYNPSDLNHTPTWMQVSAPWLGMVFPALIVVLSMTTDHILDHAPSRGIDVATFRERERKRVDMLQVRLDTERALLKLETELSTLRRNREQTNGHVHREWIFWRWLRPVVLDQATAFGGKHTAEVEQELHTLHTTLEHGLAELGTLVSTQDAQMKTWIAEMGRHMDTLNILVTHVQKHVGRVPMPNVGTAALMGPGAQETEDVPIKPEDPTDQRASVGSGHAHTSEKQRAAVAHENHGEEQGTTADLILAAILRLGTYTPDTWIAREVGCSRRTVARWKKRFLEQGLLPAAKKSDVPPYTLREDKGQRQESRAEADPIHISSAGAEAAHESGTV